MNTAAVPSTIEPPKSEESYAAEKHKVIRYLQMAKNAPRLCRAQVLMACFTLSFYMQSNFVTNLMVEKMCLRMYPEDICKGAVNSTVESEVQEPAAQYLLYHYLIKQIPAIVLSLFMGSWSDIYGRKFVIIASITGNILTLILYLLNYYFYSWSPEALILSGIPAGLTGDYASFMLGLFGFLSDINTLETLSRQVSITDGVELFCSQIGPLIGQQMYASFSYPSVFIACIVILIGGILWTCFQVKDEMFEKRSLKQMAADFFTKDGLSGSLKTLLKKRQDNKRTYIFCVLISCMVIFFGYFGHAEIIYLYTRRKVEWNLSFISYYNFLYGGCAAIGTLILLPLLIHFFKVTDISAGIAGQLGFMAFYIGTALANDTVSMYCVCIIQIVATMSFVTLRSCVCKCVTAPEVGKIMAIYAVLQALCRVLGQSIATQIYTATLKNFPGAFFLMAGIIFIIPIGLYGWVYFDLKRRHLDLNKGDEMHMSTDASSTK